MSLAITFRPQKDLYAVNPPTAYDEAYYNSRWVSGHLPVQYKISNTKWPENSDDDVDNICAVSNINGFAQINLCGSYETYVKYEYIKIENSTVTSYNGVWQILDVPAGANDTYTLSAAYDGTATGTMQRYYNNYYNLVKVYAGIPSYHQYESDDPMSLVATLKISPNADNLAIADISGLIQAKINCDNDLDQLSGANDLNAWTGFYIEYAESYDTSDGVEVTTLTSDYITDTNTGCEATNIIINGDFPANLNGWTNGGSGTSTWIWASNKAQVTNPGGITASRHLYQVADFLQGVEYNIRLTVSNNEANSMTAVVSVFKDTTLSPQYTIHSNAIVGTETLDFNFVPASDFSVISVKIFFGGTAAQIATLDDVSATVSDCTYYGFAINGTRQFQNLLGGNFGDYVQNFNDEDVLNKFLTHFTSPIWFNSLYFDISTIIPKSTFNGTEDGILYYSIKEYTEGGGFIQRQDLTIASKDDGVYRLPISGLTLDTETENFDLQIYQLPTNKLEDGDRGTFEYTVDSAGNPPSDWGLIYGAETTSLIQSSLYARTGTYSLRGTIGAGSFPAETIAWASTSAISVQQNSDYIIEGYVLFPSAHSVLDGTTVGVRPIGISTTYEELVEYDNSVLGQFYYFKVVFNTGANSSVTLKGVINNPTGSGGGVLFHFDDITMKGPVENLSETKNIKVDNSCTKQNIYLSWLNNLGAWEYYNFKAQKDYGVDIEESTSIERDIFNNWDDNFINGETEGDYISIQAAETVTIRSQFMTQAELNAVKNIRYAIRVQHVTSEDSKITVMVDKKSFKVRSDGDRLFQLEFDIKYPRIQIQRQ